MFLIKTLIFIISGILCQTACYLNLSILIAIFYTKKVPAKPDLVLFYFRLVTDTVYPFCASLNKIYYFLHLFTEKLVIRNATFFMLWPIIPLGIVRSILMLSINIDRLGALYFPIFYFKYHRKFPISIIVMITLTYILIDQYVMFEYCNYRISVPLDCFDFQCAVNQCVFEHWFYRDQVMYFSNGFLSILLCFRLYIWNTFKQTASSHALSRATRIAVLDSIVIFCFHIIPLLVFRYFPTVNYYSFGPWTAVFKHSGFTVEAIILRKLLFREKKVICIRIAPHF